MKKILFVAFSLININYSSIIIDSSRFFSFITSVAANHAQPNWLNNPVKLASRACLLSAACVHELLCGATFDRGPLCFVLKDTEEP